MPYRRPTGQAWSHEIAELGGLSMRRVLTILGE